jgi:hypothetical protein
MSKKLQQDNLLAILNSIQGQIIELNRNATLLSWQADGETLAVSDDGNYSVGVPDGGINGVQIADGSITADHIQANSISANHIQANTITANQISAHTITADQITAGTITANEISAHTITADEIAAGTITADQIATNTITAGQIAAGTITASQIAAGTITADKISTGTLTATQIAAGTITATQIAASTITSDKLNITGGLSSITSNMGSLTAGTITGGTIQTAATGSRVVMDSLGLRGYALNGITKVFEINAGSGVASFTGVAFLDPTSVIPAGSLSGMILAGSLPPIGGVNQFPNSSFEDVALSQFNITQNGGSGATLTSSTAQFRFGTRSILITVPSIPNSPYFGLAPASYMPCTPTEMSTASAYLKTTIGTRNAQVTIQWFNSSGGFISQTVAQGAVNSSTWTRLSVTEIAPSFAAKANVIVLFLATTAADGLYIDGAQFESGNVVTAYAPIPTEILPGTIGTTMLQDAAITDAKIAALAASKITGQLTDSQLAAIAASKLTGTLSDAQLAAIAASKITGQITTTQITNSAITTPKINTGAVTANEIAADTIVAGNIAANAITVSELAANSVTAAKIVANTITASQIAAATITATEIAAATITSAKIAVGTITAGNIAADTIVAGNIATDAITATELSAGSVTTAKMTANTINGDRITASTLDATKIIASSITATQIAAGAITANTIAAGAVTAQKLSIEWGGANMILDSGFGKTGLPDYFPVNSTPASVTGQQRQGSPNTTAGRFTTTASGDVYAVQVLNIVANKPYTLSAYFKAGSTSRSAICTIDWFDVGGSSLGQTNGNTITTVSSEYIRSVATGIAPATAVTARIYLIVYASVPGGISYFSDVQFEPGEIATAYARTVGEILPGEVGNTKLAPDSVTTDKILAATIIGTDIAASTITATNILANTITASKIAAGTITANEIAAGTITSTSLSATAIDGKTITGATIQTASGSVSRIVLNSTGLKQFVGSSGTPSVYLPADGSAAIFTGTVNAAGVIIQAATSASYLTDNMVTWKNSSGNVVLQMVASDYNSTTEHHISTKLLGGRNPANLVIDTETSTGTPVRMAFGHDPDSIYVGDPDPYTIGIHAKGAPFHADFIKVGSREFGRVPTVGVTIGAGYAFGIVVREVSSTGAYVAGAGTDYYAGGAGINYAPFTGSHTVKLIDDEYLPGMILASTGNVIRGESLSTTLPEVALATQETASATYGIYVNEMSRENIETLLNYYNPAPDERIAFVNGLGEGMVYVVDTKGEINNGDLITVSEIPGMGCRQDDDVFRNTTVAKATESSNFESQEASFMHDDQPVKIKLITCTYHCS